MRTPTTAQHDHHHPTPTHKRDLTALTPSFAVLLSAVSTETKKSSVLPFGKQAYCDLQVNNPYGSAIFILTCKGFAENIIKCIAIKNQM